MFFFNFFFKITFLVIDKGLSEDSVVLSQADVRIRKTQYNTMHRLLCDTLSEYNELQNQYREKCKATIKRQLEYSSSHSLHFFLIIFFLFVI